MLLELAFAAAPALALKVPLCMGAAGDVNALAERLLPLLPLLLLLLLYGDCCGAAGCDFFLRAKFIIVGAEGEKSGRV